MSSIVDGLVRLLVGLFGVSDEEARKWVFVTVGGAAVGAIALLWRWLKLIPGWLWGLFGMRQFEERYRKAVLAANRYIKLRGIRTETPVQVELEKVYLALRFEEQGAEAVDLAQALQHSGGRLAVVGLPGSGKTTLLAWMAARLADGKHELLGLDRARLPVLVTLRDLPETDEGRLTVDNIERAAVPDALAEAASPPPDFVKTSLKHKRSIVLIDGLDEVGSAEARADVVDELEQLISNFPGNLWVLTSRPPGFRGTQPAGFVRADICSLSDEDVRAFCEHWYLAMATSGREGLPEADRRQAEHEGRQLGQRLAEALLDPDSPALRDLADTPLMLTIIAVVHQFRGELPRRRIELYDEVSWAFLGGRDTTKGITLPIEREHVVRVLERLAYSMHEDEQAQLGGAEFVRRLEATLDELGYQVGTGQLLSYLCDRAGIVREGRPGEYEFSHLTFQEYFAARHLRTEHGDNAWPVLGGRVSQSWWREAVLLYAALGNPARLLEELLDRAEDDETFVPLAGKILAEAAKQTVPPDLGVRVADRVLAQAFPQVERTTQPAEDAVDAVVAVGRSDACEQAARRVAEALVDIWLGDEEPPVAPPSVEEVPLAFEVLLTRAIDGDDRAWKAVPEAAAQLGAAAVAPFVDNLRSVAPGEACLLAGPMRGLPPEIESALIGLAEGDAGEEQAKAMDLLGLSGGADGEACLRRLGEAHGWSGAIGIPAACALASRGEGGAAAEGLVRALQEGYRPVSGSGLSIEPVGLARLLAQLGGPESQIAHDLVAHVADAADALRRRIDDEPSQARAAERTLELIRQTEVVHALGAATGHQDAATRRSAVHALAALRDPRACDALIACLDDGDNTLRALAAYTLGRIGDPSAVEPLTSLGASDAPPHVQRAATHALEAIRADAD